MDKVSLERWICISSIQTSYEWKAILYRLYTHNFIEPISVKKLNQFNTTSLL